jgi:hypothetical protein
MKMNKALHGVWSAMELKNANIREFLESRIYTTMKKE